MKLEDLTKDLEEQLDIKFVTRESKVRKSGEKWTIVNVVLHDAVLIGTITFRDDVYYHHKANKKEDRRDLCIIDQKFFRFERYMLDGFMIPLAMYSSLAGYAESIVSWDLAQKVKWRRENPKRDADGNIIPRRPLTGKNVRFVLRALCLNISDNKEQFRNSVIDIVETYYGMPELARRL